MDKKNFKVVVSSLDEDGNETIFRTVKRFCSNDPRINEERAREYAEAHEQDFADDTSVYVVYIERY